MPKMIMMPIIDFFELRDARIMGMIIYQLTNNWNELEEWINRNCFYDNDTLTYEELINKMEEIKESNK